MTNSEHLQAAVVANVAAALAEDLGSGDLTAGLVDDGAMATAVIVARDAMTVAGQPWVDEVFACLSADIRIEWLCNDGDRIDADSELCLIKGPARAILSGERTALNFLQTLSATATRTSRYVGAIKGSKAQILDTRKTIPGLRLAQKYAVRCGGGNNHRIGLFDAVLIKENHIISSGGIAAAVARAREQQGDLPIEVEVESIAELKQALAANADRILLDNFDMADLQLAVEINQTEGNPPADLEASGGITLANIASIAESGVDYISVGALTKDVQAADLSMRFRYED